MTFGLPYREELPQVIIPSSMDFFLLLFILSEAIKPTDKHDGFILISIQPGFLFAYSTCITKDTWTQYVH